MRRRAVWVLGTALALTAAGAVGVVVLRGRPEKRALSFAAVAATYLGTGDAVHAEELARRAIDASPGVALGHLVLGRALLAQGRDDEAAAPLRVVADVPPAAPDGRAAYADANLLLGRLALGAGALDEGSHRADAAMAVGASRSAILLRADVEIRAGDLTAGLVSLRAAAESPSLDRRLLLRVATLERFLGGVLLDAELGRRALADFRRCVVPERDDDGSGEVSASAEIALGLPASALARLGRRPGADAARLRAAALRGLGDDDAAEQVLRTAIRTTPRADLHAALVRLLAAGGRVGAAVAAATSARTAFPADADVRAAALAVARSGRDALDPLRFLAAAVVTPAAPLDDPWGPVYAASVARSAGADAGRARLGAMGPDVVASLLARDAEGRAGDEDAKALGADVDAILAARDGDPQGRMWRGLLLFAAGDARAARDEFAAAARAAPTVAEVRALHALALDATGRYEEAVAAANEAVRLAPARPVLRAVASRVLLAAGDFDGAAIQARRGLGTSPDDPCLLAALSAAIAKGAAAAPAEKLLVESGLAVRRGDVTAAVEMVNEAATLGAAPPDLRRIASAAWDAAADAWASERAKRPGDPEPVLREADAHVRGGRVDAARRVLEGAAGSATAAIDLRLAEVLDLLGDRTGADAACAAALAKSPDAAEPRLAQAWRQMASASAPGDARAAASILCEILRGPGAARTKLRAARALLLAREPDPADVSAVEGWLRTEPDGLGFTGKATVRAMLAGARGDWAQAASDAEEACAASPHDADAHIVAAFAALRRSRRADVETHVRAALSSASAPPDVRTLAAQFEVQLALTSLAAGRVSEAAASARAAIAGSAVDEIAVLVLARALSGGDAAPVVDADARALDAAAPSSPLGPILRAQTALAHHEAKSALLHAREALARAPLSRTALALAVSAALADGDPDAAELACRRVLAAGDVSGRGDHLLGVVLERRADVPGAIAAYRAARLRDPGHLRSLAKLVQLLVATGRRDEAQTLVRAARAARANAATETALARLLAAAGDVEGAIEALHDTTSRAAADVTAWTELGRIQLMAGDAAEAQSAFEAAIAADPRRPGAYFGLLSALHRQGRVDDAVQRFTAATLSRPEDPAPWCVLGIAAAARKDWTEAERSYRKALACDPRCAVAGNNLAWLLAIETSRPDAALPIAATAAVWAAGDADVADTHAWVLHLNRREADALAESDRACRIRPGSAEMHLHRAEILAALDRRDPAVQAFGEAQRLDASIVTAQASARLRDLVASPR